MRIIKLLDKDQPAWRYILKSALLSSVGAIVINLAVIIVVLAQAGCVQKSELSVKVLITSILAAPMFETLLMIPVFWILRILHVKRVALIVCSAVIWSCYHVYFNGLNSGLISFWPFLILSNCYLTFEVTSRSEAYARTYFVHTIHNIMACLYEWGFSQFL